jgi:hypothetical protein
VSPMNSLYDPLKTIVERVVGKPEVTQRSPTLSIGDKSPYHSLTPAKGF